MMIDQGVSAMFCPKCRGEFREGFTRCHKCDVALVEELSPVEPKIKLPSEPPRDLIKFASFLSPIDAYLVRMRLEAEGIDCFLLDVNLVEMDWLYSNAVGGVKLYIDRKNLEKAQSITVTSDEAETDRKCPHCGSDNLVFEKFSRLSFFGGWLFCQFPLPYLKNKWRCLKCGHTWKKFK
jgi:predicted RNA-binding Zn-ribbon protein involved in translation (DUF1610 family)